MSYASGPRDLLSSSLIEVKEIGERAVQEQSKIFSEVLTIRKHDSRFRDALVRHSLG